MLRFIGGWVRWEFDLGGGRLGGGLACEEVAPWDMWTCRVKYAFDMWYCRYSVLHGNVQSGPSSLNGLAIRRNYAVRAYEDCRDHGSMVSSLRNNLYS